MYGCHAYTYASVLCVCLVLEEAGRGLWVPGAGVRDSFEPVIFYFLYLCDWFILLSVVSLRLICGVRISFLSQCVVLTL